MNDVERAAIVKRDRKEHGGDFVDRWGDTEAAVKDRHALLEENERLKAELDSWQRAASARTKRILYLRDALRRYGTHESTCGYIATGNIAITEGGFDMVSECTCGLDAALAGKK